MAKPKFKSKRILLIAAILIVAGLGIWYATRAKSSTGNKTAPAMLTKEKTDSARTDDANKNDPTMDKKSEPTTSTSSTESKALYITVSRPVNNDTIALSEGIELRSVVSGATNGACSLALVGPGGKVSNKSVSITPQPSYGSCSFDVPGSELVAGDWTLTLTATSGNDNGKTSLKLKVQ